MKIYLPHDADGNVIPSNVKMLYKKNGAPVHVDDLVYGIALKSWHVVSGKEVFNPIILYLNKPDTLEQLAADFDRVANDPDRAVCTYLNRDKRNCCGCKFKNSIDEFGNRDCTKSFLLDIAARVHRLAGDDE